MPPLATLTLSALEIVPDPPRAPGLAPPMTLIRPPPTTVPLMASLPSTLMVAPAPMVVVPETASTPLLAPRRVSTLVPAGTVSDWADNWLLVPRLIVDFGL